MYVLMSRRAPVDRRSAAIFRSGARWIPSSSAWRVFAVFAQVALETAKQGRPFCWSSQQKCGLDLPYLSVPCFPGRLCGVSVFADCQARDALSAPSAQNLWQLGPVRRSVRRGGRQVSCRTRKSYVFSLDPRNAASVVGMMPSVSFGLSLLPHTRHPPVTPYAAVSAPAWGRKRAPGMVRQGAAVRRAPAS